MADFFEEGFSLHGCFIKTAAAAIPVQASDDILKQAMVLGGEEAEFTVTPGPAVAKSDGEK